MLIHNTGYKTMLDKQGRLSIPSKIRKFYGVQLDERQTIYIIEVDGKTFIGFNPFEKIENATAYLQQMGILPPDEEENNNNNL